MKGVKLWQWKGWKIAYNNHKIFISLLFCWFSYLQMNSPQPQPSQFQHFWTLFSYFLETYFLCALEYMRVWMECLKLKHKSFSSCFVESSRAQGVDIKMNEQRMEKWKEFFSFSTTPKNGAARVEGWIGGESTITKKWLYGST